MEGGLARGHLPPKHPRGIVGARHVVLATEEDARLAVRDIIRIGGAAVFTGSSGTSKTYMAVSIAERLAIRPIYYEVQNGTRGNDLYVAALEHARAPGTFDPSAPKRMLRGGLSDECLQPVLWILDEVHLSGAAGRDMVRYLIGQPMNRAAFLLVGEHVEKWVDVDPAFESRVARWIPFPEATPEQMVAFARAFHPLYETASSALLQRVATYAGVHKRKWARVIEACQTITDGAADRLSRELLTDALHTIGR